VYLTADTRLTVYVGLAGSGAMLRWGPWGAAQGIEAVMGDARLLNNNFVILPAVEIPLGGAIRPNERRGRG
jgi:hypothetical protein